MLRITYAKVNRLAPGTNQPLALAMAAEDDQWAL
jgi:hypothetical protein